MSNAPSTWTAGRLADLLPRLAAQELEALLITQPANVFYLTGFRGSAGVVLLTPDAVRLITDSRYATVAKGLVAASGTPPALTFVEVESSYEETIRAVLLASGATRVGIETAHMTVERHDWLERALAGSTVTLHRTSGLVEAIRLVKDEHELATLRAGGRRISGVMEEMLRGLRVGRAEREVAADIDWAIRAAGFEGPAFETIVAAGPNTALPHARPGERRLAAGDLVLLDFGGLYDGYCVDLTRVASLGPAGPEAVAWHAAVREAHGAALTAVRPGVVASDVDAAARTALAGRGLGAAFGHGTGHGLGIEVHEGPRVGKPRSAAGSDDAAEGVRLVPGMVFTVEPGVYLPGRGGVRLEDDLAVTETGYELLTSVSLDLLVV